MFVTDPKTGEAIVNRKNDPDMAELRGVPWMSKKEGIKYPKWPNFLYPPGREKNARYVFMSVEIAKVCNLYSCTSFS